MGIPTDKETIKTNHARLGVVLPFPKSGVKHPAEVVVEKDINALQQQQKLLRFHFRNIKDTQRILSEHNLRCANAEGAYDEMLLAYAQRVGAENVSTQLMNYGTNVVPVVTTTGIKLVLEDE